MPTEWDELDEGECGPCGLVGHLTFMHAYGYGMVWLCDECREIELSIPDDEAEYH